MKKVITILVLIHLLGCTRSNSKCVITKNKLLQKYGSRIFGTNVIRGKISDFRDKGKDSIIAGYYTFYENERLKSYQFFANMGTYIYDEEYDENGDLVKVQGNPFVHNTVKLISDSLVIKMYFFSLNKVYSKIHATTSDNRNLELIAKDDTLYSNMKMTSLAFTNLKEDQDIYVYLNFEYESQCTRKNEVFKDTVALHYTKNPQ